MIKIIRIIASVTLAAATGGCWAGVYENPAAEYFRRTDTITTSAGNAKEVNAATHIIDPWPPRVANRRIPGNGARMSRAMDRYNPSQTTGSQSGPQVVGIPVGAATPPSSPGSTVGTPIQ